MGISLEIPLTDEQMPSRVRGPVTFTKRQPEDGKACFDVHKKKDFLGIIRFFKESKEWAFLKYPSGRIERFDSLAEAKDEAKKS